MHGSALDGLVCSLNAAAGVAVSDCASFVHDFGWNVRAGFVFDVDDTRFLVALQYHFLMTFGQHGVRRFRQPVITSWKGDRRSILTH